jgi:hypothetical protein
MRRTLYAASLLTLVAAAARAQEPILLRISGHPGQANHYQTVVETFMRAGQMAAMMNPDTNLPFSRMTMLTTRTMTGTSGDTLNFSEVIDSVAMEAPAMPQMAGMMGGMAAQMRGRTTATKMDGRGRIFSAEVQGGAMGMGGGMGGPGGGPGGRGGRGGMMGGGRSGPTPFILPAQPVRPGDIWTDSTTTPGNGTDPSVSVHGTFKLERVDQRAGSRIAVISWTGTVTTVNPQGSQVMNVVGEIDVDLSAQRLAAMNMTMSGIVQTPQGEVPMRMHMTQAVM